MIYMSLVETRSHLDSTTSTSLWRQWTQLHSADVPVFNPRQTRQFDSRFLSADFSKGMSAIPSTKQCKLRNVVLPRNAHTAIIRWEWLRWRTYAADLNFCQILCFNPAVNEMRNLHSLGPRMVRSRCPRMGRGVITTVNNFERQIF